MALGLSRPGPCDHEGAYRPSCLQGLPELHCSRASPSRRAGGPRPNQFCPSTQSPTTAGTGGICCLMSPQVLLRTGELINLLIKLTQYIVVYQPWGLASAYAQRYIRQRMRITGVVFPQEGPSGPAKGGFAPQWWSPPLLPQCSPLPRTVRTHGPFGELWVTPVRAAEKPFSPERPFSHVSGLQNNV